MRKAGLPVLILILAGLPSLAQKNFLPGYIIRNNADTVRGTIDYRNWEVNPSRINFRTMAGLEQNLSKSDISGFVIEGKDKYERVYITRDMNIVNLQELGYNPKDSTVTDSIFLRVLVEGNRATLYEYVDFKTHFFIRPGTGEAEELVYKVRLDPQSSGLITNNGFRSQLKRYLTANPIPPHISKAADQLTYELSSLVKFMSFINDAGTTFIPPDARKNSLKTKFFAGAGMVTRKLGFTGEEEVLKSLRFNSTVSYVVCAGLDLYSPRDLGNLLARVEISMSGSSGEGAGTSGTPGALTERDNSYSFKAIYIAPAISIVYSFIRTDNFKIYVAPSFAINFGSYKTHKLISTYVSNGNTYTIYDLPMLQKSWAGQYINAGVFIKDKFEICIGYQVGGTFIEHVSIKETSNPVTLRAHFRF